MKPVLLAGLDRGPIWVPGPFVSGVGLGLVGVLAPTTLRLTLLVLTSSAALTILTTSTLTSTASAATVPTAASASPTLTSIERDCRHCRLIRPVLVEGCVPLTRGTLNCCTP